MVHFWHFSVGNFLHFLDIKNTILGLNMLVTDTSQTYFLSRFLKCAHTYSFYILDINVCDLILDINIRDLLRNIVPLISPS